MKSDVVYLLYSCSMYECKFLIGVFDNANDPLVLIDEATEYDKTKNHDYPFNGTEEDQNEYMKKEAEWQSNHPLAYLRPSDTRSFEGADEYFVEKHDVF